MTKPRTYRPYKGEPTSRVLEYLGQLNNAPKRDSVAVDLTVGELRQRAAEGDAMAADFVASLAQLGHDHMGRPADA